MAMIPSLNSVGRQRGPGSGRFHLTNWCHRCGAAAASGFAFACYAVAADHGIIARDEAAARVAHGLRFLWNGEQSEAPDASGLRGFFYHFLDRRSGGRVWRCELSTVDSAILRVPAGRVLRTDERGLPVGSLAVAGTDDDFTRPRRCFSSAPTA